jgi:peptidoglycan/LPS O-acetylase OafA/YrhL
MTETKAIGSRGAALVLVVAGSLTLLLSFQRWTSCPTTPCGGILMAISDYSGIDLGFGVVTALGGLLLAAIGLGALRRKGVSRFATAAALLALLIVVTAGASVVWMYVIPGDDKEFYWPPFTTFLVGIVGLIALAASLWLWRATLSRP